MLRRVIDLSLECDPLTSGPLSGCPLPSHIEPTGLGHPRQFVQQVCHMIPHAFEDNEIGVDVYLGDSLPHTHAESLLIAQSTILDQVPKHQKWAIRPISSIPAAEWVREAAVIDLSHLGPGTAPSLEAVKKAARHLHWGDFVIWNTGYYERTKGSSSSEQKNTAGIPFAVAQWLTEDMGIVGIMSDIPVDPVQDYGKVGGGAAKVHTYFYQNAVLMIDNAVNFDLLDAERVFFCGGLCLKTSGIGSSPARAIALRGDSPDLNNRQIVDLFTPMHSLSGQTTSSPIEHLEPFELQPYIFKRYEVYGMQIAGDPESDMEKSRGGHIRPQRDYGSPIRLFHSHLGTHMRIPHVTSGSALAGNLIASDIAKLSSNQFVGSAVLLDLTSVGPQQTVTRRLVEKEAAGLKPGDIALLWTGFSDRYYQRADYLRWSPRFELGALEWLVDQGAKMLVTDTPSLEPHPWDLHLTPAAVPLLSKRSVPAVMCATNLWLVRKRRCFAICSPLPLEGLTTVPARLIVVEDWE